jgi:hypothetical protein
MDTYRFIHEDHRGIALPIFIHNFNFYLVTLDIYEDGVADCWELVAIDELDTKIAEGWIDTEPPEGAEISISNLGNAHAIDAQWIFPRQNLVPTAQAIFNQLNPDRENLLDLNQRRKQIALEAQIPEDRIWQTRSRSDISIYRESMISGAEVPLFQVLDQELRLIHCFVYQDHQAQIGYQGDLFPVEQIQTMLERGELVTAIPDGAWVTLPGLGRFRAVDAYWYIDSHERWREILNLMDVLNGQADAVEVCYQAFLIYQSAPTEIHREQLRAAYEAVPEHQRLYTQRDQDAKDHDIRRILHTKR